MTFSASRGRIHHTRPFTSGMTLSLLILISGLIATNTFASESLEVTESVAGQELVLNIDGKAIILGSGKTYSRETIRTEPESPVVSATWTETDDSGISTRHYAVSLDRRNVQTIRSTHYDLMLRQDRFDPADRGPQIEDHLRAPIDSRIYIVQYWTQSLEHYRKNIQQLGAEIHRYLPNHASIVEMDEETADEVRQLPYVRWVGPFHLAYKMDEHIQATIADTSDETVYRVNLLSMSRGSIGQSPVLERIWAIGGEVYETSPETYLFTADLTASQMLEVAAMDEVQWMDFWGAPENDMDIARNFHGADYVEGITGYSGQDVRIEVMDSGLDTTHPDILNFTIHNGNTPGDHGTAVSGIVVGSGAGDAAARGTIPDAHLVVGDYQFFSGSRYNHTGELQDAGGVYKCVLQTNSWGSARTRAYTAISQDLDLVIFDWDRIGILQSQSNAGNQDSRPQAWSKNVISVGGIRHNNSLTKNDDSWTSGASIGPAEDGRIKPDLASFYDWTYCTDQVGSAGYTSGNYVNFGGTSGATPIVAGQLGMIYQMWSDGLFGNATPGASVFENRPYNTTAKALLINTATQWTFSGTGHDLTRVHQGWGHPDLRTLYDMRDNIYIIDESDVLSNLGSTTHTLTVPPNTTEFKATLVYRDLPGTTSANQHRINDLNLKVTAPDGTIYWGNNGLDANMYSTPGGSANTVDTVENVFVSGPSGGTWLVEVIAAELNGDSHTETGATDADYALVVSGIVKDVISIPDANFKAHLTSNYDTNSDGEISSSEAAAVTGTLDVNGLSISDLTGVNAFTGITILDARNNTLTSLPTISALTALRELKVSYNQLASLPDLSALTQLRYLYCSGNNLTALPALVSLTNLQQLWCNNNQLGALPDLTGLNSLILIYAQYNQFTDLPDTSMVANLNFFQAHGNSYDSGDCAAIAAAEARGMSTFTYNPQADGSTLTCSLVTIPDAIFKSHLVANYDTSGDGEINTTEAEAVTGTLNVNGLGISDLTGIEAFTGITTLDARNNNLTGLPAIPNLGALRDLKLSYNQLTSLPSLSNQSELRFLYCSGNSLTALPSLAGLTNMQQLWCNNNQLTALPDMTGLSNLIILYAQYNNFTSMPDTSGLTALNYFQIYRNQFDSGDCAGINGVEARGLATFIYNPQSDGSTLDCAGINIPDVTLKSHLVTNYDTSGDGEISTSEAEAVTGTINLNGLGISDLTGIEAFVNINTLDARNNNLTGVPDISALTALRDLKLSYNQLTSLPSLSALTDLRFLYCSGNSLTGLPSLAGLANLQQLWCNNNQLTALPDMTGLTNLIILYAQYNSFTSVPDTSGLTALNYFQIYRNQFDSGDCAGITAVEARGLASFIYNPQSDGSTLNCAGINIPDVTLKAHLVTNYDTSGDGEISTAEAEAITGTINLNGLGISDLTGIEAFVNITTLDARNNNLTSVPDISALTALRDLKLSYNQLASMPALSALTNLRFLYCSGNQLTSLPSLTGLTSLQQLWCNNNQLTALPDLTGLSSLVLIYAQYNNFNEMPDTSPATALNYFQIYRNNFDSGDCADIQAVEARSLNSFIYNPQSDGSTLSCALLNVPDANFKSHLVTNYDTSGDGEISYGEAAAVTGTLDVNGLSIADLTGVEAFTGITILDARNNSLTGLPDISALTALRELKVSYNQLTSLPALSGLSQLRYIYCSGNQLTSLPALTGLVNLLQLWCNNNQLTALPDMTGCTSMILLYAQYNNFSAVPDLSALTSLNYLQLHRNQFDSGDCTQINNLLGQGLATFTYNPQADGSTVNCLPEDAKGKNNREANGSGHSDPGRD